MNTKEIEELKKEFDEKFGAIQLVGGDDGLSLRLCDEFEEIQSFLLKKCEESYARGRGDMFEELEEERV